MSRPTSPSIRVWLALVVLTAAPLGRAQEPVPADRPAPAAPLRPQTQQELDRREALKLYALGQMQERDSRLLDALATYERALRLDPDSAVLRKTLAPLYLAVDRTEDALAACKEALDLDPRDDETWVLYARQFKAQGRDRDAAVALARAGDCPALKEHPELRWQVCFDLGTLWEGVEEFEKAETAFGEAVRILDKPEVLLEQGAISKEELAAQAAEACERLGRVCVRAKHFDQAAVAYRKAQEKDPRRRQRLDYHLADVYLGQDKLPEALASLDEYLKTQPQGIEAYELKASVLHRLGRDREVLPALTQYARENDKNQDLQLLLARTLAQANRYDEAEGVYQALLKESVHPDVYRGLFGVYRARGGPGAVRMLTLLDETVARATPDDNRPGNPNGDAAEAARARAMLVALRDDPDLVKALLVAVRPRLQGQASLHHETRRFLSVLAAHARQLDDAERLYRSCLATATGGNRAKEPELYSGLLRVLWLAHKYEAIVEVCRQGLEQAQNTDRLTFHLDLSRALVLLDKKAEAVAEAEKAVDIARDAYRLDSRRNRAVILAQAGRFDDALARCEEMLAEFTKAEQVHETRYTLSNVYSLAKNYPKAEEQLQLILKDHPDDATAHNDLGYIWADQGKNLEEAERLIRRALELDRAQRTAGARVDPDSDRDNAAYLDSLGWVLFRRSQLPAARLELERAAALPDGEDDPVVWDHLGDVYARLHESAKAKAAWQKAVELYETARRRPTDDRYRDLRQKLKLLEASVGQR